jgi:hypothetical protein
VVVRDTLSRIETDLSKLGAERNGTINTFQNMEDLDRDGDDHDVVSLVESSSDSESSEAGQDESQEDSIDIDDFGEDDDSDNGEYNSP